MLHLYFVIFVCSLLLLLYYGTKKPRGFPPGPVRIPLIGYTTQIDTKLAFRTWNKLRPQYGEVLGLYFGQNAAVVVNGWEAIKEGLMNDDLSWRPDVIFINDLNKEKGIGLIFANGDLWKEQRRFVLSHSRNLGFGRSAHEQMILEESKELINALKSFHGQPFRVQTEIGISSINIVWAFIGGNRFPRSNSKFKELVDNLNMAFKSGQLSQGIEGICPPIRHLLPESSPYKTLLRGFNGCREIIMESIDEHKKRYKGGDPKNLIDFYLQEGEIQVSDSNFSTNQLAAVCMDLLSAGTDTSASFLSFAILFLCLYPEMQEKVQKELDSVCGKERLACVADKQDLVYSEAFLQEVFRYRSVAPHSIPHFAQKDTTLQGHRIPKDTFLIFHLRSILMDKEYWGDPETFRPERFIEDGKIKKFDRMITFGKGRRVCAGQSLAKLSSFLLFNSLAKTFHFEFSSEETPADTEGTLGLTLSPPLFKVIATPR